MPKRDAEHMRAQSERILRATIHCMGALGTERTSGGDLPRGALRTLRGHLGGPLGGRWVDGTFN